MHSEKKEDDVINLAPKKVKTLKAKTILKLQSMLGDGSGVLAAFATSGRRGG
jgi:hypothetical protein